MSYKFYQTYIDKVEKSPKEFMEEECQESIDYAWENNASVYNILSQSEIGSKEYIDESVMINSVINSTTGENFGDYYRKIIHKNYANATNYLGKMYKFYNETWLTINTNTKIGSSKNSILQKCNNVLKWKDNKGIIHEWECVYGRNLGSTNLSYGSSGVPEIKADAQILVQRNLETNSIDFNQRFLLDKHAFQIKQFDNHYSETLMTIYIFEVPLQPNDDLENGIASGIDTINRETNDDIISPTVKKILLNETQEYNVYNYINGVKTNDTFTIEINSDLDNSYYDFNVVDGNTFTIKNLKESNKNIIINCTNNITSNITSIEIMLGGKW